MKTNITIESRDRELFGITIRQQTQDGFMNLSDLNDAYLYARVKQGLPDKDIHRIMADNKEALFYLLEKQGIIKTHQNGFMEDIENQGFVKYMKTIGAYKTTGRGINKTVWVNPYIFVMVAMELSQLFKAHVISWVTDSLIINRIEAGNFYKELSSAVSKFKNVDYVQMAKGLNYCVFGKHETGLRNTATQSQLKELERLESKLAFAINMGYITSFDMLISELRTVYSKNAILNH